MTTGSMSPLRSGEAVLSLNCLTNMPMLTPWAPRAGPTGGAGVALPPGHWSLTWAVTCLAMGVHQKSRPAARAGPGSVQEHETNTPRVAGGGFRFEQSRDRSGLVHLPVVELDRHRPPEDADFDRHLRRLGRVLRVADLLDFAFHVRKSAFADPDLVALLEVELDLRLG